MESYTCANCRKSIETDDFETFAYFLRVLPVHKNCASQFNIGLPVSGMKGNVIALISFMLSAVCYIYFASPLIALAAAYPVVMRLVSYLTYKK